MIYPSMMVWIITVMIVFPTGIFGAIFTLMAFEEGTNPAGPLILLGIAIGSFVTGSRVAGKMIEKEFGVIKKDE